MSVPAADIMVIMGSHTPVVTRPLVLELALSVWKSTSVATSHLASMVTMASTLATSTAGREGTPGGKMVLTHHTPAARCKTTT